MKLLDSIKELSHHAYLITGSEKECLDLKQLLNEHHRIVLQANPDLLERRYQSFNIDNAREIKQFHSMRPVVSDAKKIFILTIDNITTEAQNALLKLLEEPADYAIFFLLLPSTHLLLPTIKSRLFIIDNNSNNYQDTSIYRNDLNIQAEKFVQLNQIKRLEFIKKLIEDISKEKTTKQYVLDFLNAVELVIYNDNSVTNNTNSLETIELARKYISDRSPSLKMLLEYVAVSI